MEKPCHNALIYARSRKGTVGDGFNSDFARSRRQQELVMAAADRAINARTSATEHARDAARSSAARSVWTDLPQTVEAAQELMRLAEGVMPLNDSTAVFGPRKWAYEDSQTPLYTFRLRLDLVRAWMDDRLGTPPGRR